LPLTELLRQFNRPNVDIVDIKENPITEIMPTGIKTKDGTLHEFDDIAVATGFDITTGGISNMRLRSIHRAILQDEWKSAAQTYLGTTISGSPNMFHLYGPHGPTLLSNGPSSVEVHGRWIVDAIKKAEREGLKYIDATPEATKAWKNSFVRGGNQRGSSHVGRTQDCKERSLDK